MSSPANGFRDGYGEAFAAYLADPGEQQLRAAYELGRSAVRAGLNALDLATVHHDVLADAVADSGDAHATVARAGEFFLESLSAFEMVQRVLRDARETALIERRHAAILRNLSSFLADTSLALDGASSLDEVLQLVAEHARELTGARWCFATLRTEASETVEAVACTEPGDAAPETAHELVAFYEAMGPDAGSMRMTGADLGGHPARQALAEARPERAEPVRNWLAASMTALDGRRLGVIEVFDKEAAAFSEVDEALLVQLAQMAAASVERTQLYSA